MEIVRLTNIIATISPEKWAECERHGTEVLPTVISRYTYRGSYDRAKIKRDIAQGKAAEWAAFSILHGSIPTLSEPDMEVYGAEHKSFGADLRSTCRGCGESIDYHVKCWDSDSPFPESYTFHRWDAALKSKERECKAAHDVGLFLVRTGSLYELRWIVRTDRLESIGLLELPIVQRHQTYKRTVYASTMTGLHKTSGKRKAI